MPVAPTKAKTVAFDLSPLVTWQRSLDPFLPTTLKDGGLKASPVSSQLKIHSGLSRILFLIRQSKSMSKYLQKTSGSPPAIPKDMADFKVSWGCRCRYRSHHPFVTVADTALAPRICSTRAKTCFFV